MIAVFVPGALAGGLLVSLALVIGDLVRRVRGDAPARRAAFNAASASVAEIDGESAREIRVGLRSTRVYGVVSLVSLALVALAIPGALWNFLAPDGYLSDIGWIFVASLAAVLVAGAIGVTSLRLAPSWAPAIAVAIGAGAVIRFAIGPEPIAVRVVLAIGLPVAVAVVALAVWWSRRARPVIPGWTRPLVRSTPLGTR